MIVACNYDDEWPRQTRDQGEHSHTGGFALPIRISNGQSWQTKGRVTLQCAFDLIGKAGTSPSSPPFFHSHLSPCIRKPGGATPLHQRYYPPPMADNVSPSTPHHELWEQNDNPDAQASTESCHYGLLIYGCCVGQRSIVLSTSTTIDNIYLSLTRA